MFNRIVDITVRIVRKPFGLIWRYTQRSVPVVAAAPHHLVSSDGAFYCPVCDTTLIEFDEFKRSDSRPGRKGLCPICWSLERTRAIRLFFGGKGSKYLKHRMLHFAPEKGLEGWLRSLEGICLTTTDLMEPNVDVKADITDLPFADGEFELIYCSNVLEHIEDDTAAMRELQRVLAPGGVAIIQVPIREGPTYEDLSITDPVERDKHFGQEDHVRWYGADIKNRLEDAGFRVEEVWMPDYLQLSTDEEMRFGIQKRELIHFCDVAPVSD